MFLVNKQGEKGHPSFLCDCFSQNIYKICVIFDAQKLHDASAEADTMASNLKLTALDVKPYT